MARGTPIQERAFIKDGVAYIVVFHKGEPHILMLDEADLDLVGEWSWCRQTLQDGTAGYMVRMKWEDGKGRIQYLHRELLNAGPGEVVDHKDGNILNNTRKNLRLTTQAKNASHRTRLNSNNKSGVRGVFWNGFSWSAQIRKDGHTTHLGSFETIEEAAAARRVAEKIYYGEFGGITAANQPTASVVAA